MCRFRSLRCYLRSWRIDAIDVNYKSEYFREEIKNTGEYFRRIKHTNPKEIRDYVSLFYTVTKEEAFLGIRGKRIYDTSEDKYASLYVVVGIRK